MELYSRFMHLTCVNVSKKRSENEGKGLGDSVTGSEEMGSWLEADVGSRPDVYGVSSATGGGARQGGGVDAQEQGGLSC